MSTLKRFLAYFVVLAMVMVMIPFAALAAEDDTYIFDATALAPEVDEATGEAVDKVRVEAGTTLGTDNYFVASGTIEKRTNKDGSIKAVELAKKGGGAIGFTVLGTGTVSVMFSSTGSSNASDLALVDASGNLVANSTGATVATVTGTNFVEAKFENLAAGTYSVQSTGGENTGRGTRILSITVVDISDHTHNYAEEVVPPTCEEAGYTIFTCECGHTYEGNEVTALGHSYVDGVCEVCGRDELAVDSAYTFVATDLTAEKDKEEIGDGAFVGTDDYFIVEGSVVKRVSSSVVKYVELGKELTGKIYFEVTGTADVSIGVSSTGGTNDSLIALVDSYGDTVANNEGITMVTGTGETTITYTGLTAGYYYIVSPEDPTGEISRNTRVFRVSVEETAVAVGTETNPYTRYYMGEGTVDSAVTAAGETLYYNVYGIGGMTLTMENAADAAIIYNGNTYTADENGVITFFVESAGMGRMPVALAITNNGTASALFSMSFEWPLGNVENPEVITDGSYTIAGADCLTGYYYSYTAADDGVVTFAITSEGNWQYTVNNMTTYAYGDTQWSDSDPVVATQTLEVSKGDELQIIVAGYDPANPYGATTADDISFDISLEADPGTETNPYYLYYMGMGDLVTNEVAAGDSDYYAITGVMGTILTINDADAYIIYNGETYAADENGVVSVEIINNPMMGRMPTYVQIGNNGEAAEAYTISVTIPVGTMNNPHVITDGEYTIANEDCVSDYFLNYTAPADGTVTITMIGEDWFYNVQNNTTYAYGDNHWSDDDPTVNVETWEVAEGDVLQIVIGAYDTDGEPNDVTFSVAFEPAVVIEKFDLVGASVNLGNDLTMDFFINKAHVTGEDWYVEIVKKVDGADSITTTIPYADFQDYYGLYWQVSLKGMAAKEMADAVSVTVYNGDGVAVSNTWVDSMRDYCVRQLNNPAQTKAYTLLADMLNYGAAAQTQFSYNLDDLANSTMTAEQAAYATQNFDLSSYSNNMAAGANFVGSSLSLETNIVLSMFFYKPEATSAEGLVAKVTYTDHTGAAQTLEIAEADFVVMGPLYGVNVDTLVASDVCQLVTLEVYDGDTVVVSGADSMESYAVRQGGDMNIALMKFTLSAYDFLH